MPTEREATPTRRTGAPPPATRAQALVVAALRLVDEGGLEGLTMRRLADTCNLQLPAIYRVFGNKGALLDQMAEKILSGALAERRDEPWEADVALLARQLRRALLAQRDGARIVGGSYAAQHYSLAFADRLIAAMQRAGLQGVSALWATSSLFSYVLGEALEQQGHGEGEIGRPDAAVSGAAYPHLFATPVEEIADFDGRFEFGLGLFVAGLRERAAGEGAGPGGDGRG
ncbi:TetR/AcrR family transcriptional regulator C-terminal domain-containing protein [Streptomyces sp. NPDC093252]|uniref:TetR/AcrR family transcriptional regulator C-terminal domain-containing protein n=1 Tax=Streptomyces sp. NPDC093252 TaxID=3154980 RepID=UPI003424999D